MFSLIRRELFDVVRLIPLGLVLSTVWFLLSLPSGVFTASQYSRNLVVQVGLVGTIIAIALGILQTYREMRPEVRGYLWHRPHPRSHLFWAKTIAGFTAYGLCLMTPLVAVAVYLNQLGPEKLPVSTRQALAPSVVALFAFVFHPAVIWMMSRRANWLLTRTFPLFVAVVVLFFASIGMQVIGSVPARVGWLVFNALLVLMVFHAAMYSYTQEWLDPPPMVKSFHSFSSAIGLWMASFVLFSLPMLYLLSGATSISPGSRALTMDTQGRMWVMENASARSLALANNHLGSAKKATGFLLEAGEADAGKKRVAYKSNQMSSNGATEFIPAKHKTVSFASMVTTRLPGDSQWMGSIGSFVDVTGRMTESVFLDGALYVYSDEGLLVKMSREQVQEETNGRARDDDRHRIDRAIQEFDDPMVFAFEMGSGENRRMIRLIADRHGVYQTASDLSYLRLVAEGDFRGLAMMRVGDQDVKFWIARDQALIRYQVRWDGERDVFGLEETAQYPLPERYDGFPTEVQLSRDGYVAVIQTRPFSPSHFDIFDPQADRIQSGSVELDLATLDRMDRSQFALSPAIFWGLKLQERWRQPNPLAPGNPNSTSRVWQLGTLFHALAAALLTFVAAVWQRVSGWKKWAWTVGGFLLGFSTPIALFAIHAKPVMERCDRCGKHRRFDRNTCGACGHASEPPVREGIEIFSGEKSMSGEVVMA